MMGRVTILAACILPLSAISCRGSDAGDSARAPSELHMAAGNDQHGIVGAPLPNPVVVKLITNRGKPVPDHLIAFEVVSGGGTLTADSAVTDSSGMASVHWILGDSVRDYQRLNVHAVDRASRRQLLTRVFRAIPRPRPATRLVAVAGDSQSAYPLTTLPQRVEVRALDSLGRGVPGLPITFSVVAGGGSVTGGARFSDARGFATAGEWTLGPEKGANVLFATAGSLPEIAFKATALTGHPGRILQRTGDAQFATVGRALPIPPSVTVRDEYGNPVAGARVTFITGRGTRRFEHSVASGPDGIAVSKGWTLDTIAGPQDLFVFAVGAQPTVFKASAIADRPAQLLIVAGDVNTGRVGTVVAAAPSVRVVDRYGNPIVGTPVKFATSEGPSVVTVTDSAGIATFDRWVLGEEPGVYVLMASVDELAPVEFHATATAKDGKSP